MNKIRFSLIFYIIFPRLLCALQFARLDPAIAKFKRKINEKMLSRVLKQILFQQREIQEHYAQPILCSNLSFLVEKRKLIKD